MKQKDIAIIIVVVAVSGVISFFAGRFLFNKPQNRQVQAEVVDVISTEFTRPSTKYFNESSIDPTEQVQIGQGTNAAPFTTGR